MNTTVYKDENVLKEKIKELLNSVQIDANPLIHDTLMSLLKLAHEHPAESDLKIIATTLRELRHSFKLFQPYKDFRKICLFGSARTSEEDTEYQLAREFASKITRNGYMVITGAGPGIMEAGNKGAEINMSFGVNIKLPFEQKANPYIAHDSKLISFKYFFNRKLTFIKESDATVLFPGGLGTHDEAFEVLTLVQTGRCSPRPIIMLSSPKNNYWEKWEEFLIEQLLKKNYISKEDISLYTVCHSTDRAVQIIMNFYQQYHSIYYEKELTSIRLKKPLSENSLQTLNSEFTDLLLEGEFELRSAEELKEDNEVYLELPRLVFQFNKMSYGRLIQLIKVLNQTS